MYKGTMRLGYMPKFDSHLSFIIDDSKATTESATSGHGEKI